MKKVVMLGAGGNNFAVTVVGYLIKPKYSWNTFFCIHGVKDRLFFLTR